MLRTVLALALLGLVPSTALAQSGGVAIDLYSAAETGDDGFAVSRPVDRGHLRFGAQLQGDYALAPLILGDTTADDPPQLVSHLVGLRASLSLGLIDRLVLFGSVPVIAVMEGATASGGVPQARGGGLGDPTLGARMRLVGEPDEVGALALQVTGSFPLAEGIDASQDLLGEGGATFSPEVLGEVRFAFLTVSANLGFLFRTAPTFTNLDVGHDLTWGVGVGARFLDDVLEARLESYGRVGLSDPSPSSAPTEAILGLRVRPIESLVIGVAGGPGLGPAYGTPAFRGVLSIAWSETIDVERRSAGRSWDAPTPSASHETPPQGAGPAAGTESVPASSSETTTGPSEVTPSELSEAAVGSESPTSSETRPSAPTETATDRDGTTPAETAAPEGDSPEATPFTPRRRRRATTVARPNYEALDRDADRVVDANDRCPLDREDFDEIQDDDGCPENDADQDGQDDDADQCPLTPGRAARGQCNGCPELACVVQETGVIEINQRIEFESGEANILPSSEAVLSDLLAIVSTNDQIVRLRIEGHTDDIGDDAANLALSVRRAAAVVSWLVERGIARERLAGFGCGEMHPLARGRNRSARARNRRVEFLIVEPPSGRDVLQGCQEAE